MFTLFRSHTSGGFGVTNLVFVTIDDFLSLSAWPMYQGIAVTPHLDAFLSQNVHFDAAFADVAICNPSRAAMLTGQRPWDSGVISNSQTLSHHVDLSTETLPGILKDAGYMTAVGGKFFHTLHADEQSAVADVILDSDGLRNATANTFSSIQGIDYGVTAQTLSDDTLTESTAHFLGQLAADTRFALFAGIYRPHVDWIVPQEFLDLYQGIEIPVPDFIDSADRAGFLAMLGQDFHEDVIDAGAWEVLIRHYLASLSYADAKLGEILRAVEATNTHFPTLTVVASDHGYHLGDGGHWHKHTTYEQAARAPLGFSLPGIEARSIDTPVNLSSVAATVLDLLDQDVPQGMAPSLAAAVTGNTSADVGPAITWMNGSVSVRTAEYRYTLFENGEEELFHIPTDVMNTSNRILDLPDVAATHRLMAEAALGDAMVLFPASEFVGGAGDTNYYLGSTSVEISDAGGKDRVFTAASYTLPAGIEDLHGLESAFGLTLIGQDGANTISGTYKGDILDGAGGDDVLFGGAGADLILGGDGADQIKGGTGLDHLLGGVGNDHLRGQSGHDLLEGGAGQDSLHGGAGRDEMRGQGGRDYLTGGYGNDVLYGAGGNDVLEGGPGWDTHHGGAGTDTSVILGYSYDYYVIHGTQGHFRTSNGTHEDVHISIEYMTFNDSTYSVDEYFTRSAGLTLSTEAIRNPPLHGASGPDVLHNVYDFATLYGHAGNDRLQGGSYGTLLNGGAGFDWAIYDTVSSPVTVSLLWSFARAWGVDNDLIDIENIVGSDFDDHIAGQHDANMLHGGLGDDKLRGLGGDDFLYGQIGSDDLKGQAGNDMLAGGPGHDYLAGGPGADRLSGGAGDDTLVGGSGSGVLDHEEDIFVFASSADGAGGFDRVRDWEDGIDKIDLTSFGFTDFGTQVAPLAVSRADGRDTRIDFGGGDVLYLYGLSVSNFGLDDVML